MLRVVLAGLVPRLHLAFSEVPSVISAFVPAKIKPTFPRGPNPPISILSVLREPRRVRDELTDLEFIFESARVMTHPHSSS